MLIFKDDAIYFREPHKVLKWYFVLHFALKHFTLHIVLHPQKRTARRCWVSGPQWCATNFRVRFCHRPLRMRSTPSRIPWHSLMLSRTLSESGHSLRKSAPPLSGADEKKRQKKQRVWQGVNTIAFVAAFCMLFCPFFARDLIFWILKLHILLPIFVLHVKI